MDREPLVSVIMPVYNQEKYVAETIESVLGQTFREFEFLILDDGSTDDSARIIRQYAAKDERITAYFENNAGKCRATNTLATRAKGRWCAFLDADDVMLPERLEKQLAFHQANPEITASSSHCYYISNEGQPLGIQRYPGLRTANECRQALTDNEFIKCAFTSLMVLRQAFLDTGGLRNPFWPCEDFDFANRLIENGFFLLIMEEILMKYRIHTSSISAKNPLHMFDIMDYTYYCTMLRRAGKSEISLAAFKTLRQQDSWWKKLNRKRYNYSIILHREAAFAMRAGKYASFSWLVLTASLLSPNFMLYTLLNKVTNIAKR